MLISSVHVQTRTLLVQSSIAMLGYSSLGAAEKEKGAHIGDCAGSAHIANFEMACPRSEHPN